MINTQKMNNDEIITQDIPDMHVCSLIKSESKLINADKSKWKMIVVNACYLDMSKSNNVHINVNTSKVKKWR